MKGPPGVRSDLKTDRPRVEPAKAVSDTGKTVPPVPRGKAVRADTVKVNEQALLPIDKDSEVVPTHGPPVRADSVPVVLDPAAVPPNTSRDTKTPILPNVPSRATDTVAARIPAAIVAVVLLRGPGAIVLVPAPEGKAVDSAAAAPPDPAAAPVDSAAAALPGPAAEGLLHLRRVRQRPPVRSSSRVRRASTRKREISPIKRETFR